MVKEKVAPAGDYLNHYIFRLMQEKLNFGLSSPKPLSPSARRKRMKKDMGMIDLKTLVEEIVKLVLEQQQHVIS